MNELEGKIVEAIRIDNANKKINNKRARTLLLNICTNIDINSKLILKVFSPERTDKDTIKIEDVIADIKMDLTEIQSMLYISPTNSDYNAAYNERDKLELKKIVEDYRNRKKENIIEQ